MQTCTQWQILFQDNRGENCLCLTFTLPENIIIKFSNVILFNSRRESNSGQMWIEKILGESKHLTTKLVRTK